MRVAGARTHGVGEGQVREQLARLPPEARNVVVPPAGVQLTQQLNAPALVHGPPVRRRDWNPLPLPASGPGHSMVTEPLRTGYGAEMIAAYTPPDDHAGTGPRGAPAPAAGGARRTERKPMNPRPYPHSSDPATGSRALRPVLGALCCLLLGWGSALPANAESGTIRGPRTGTITVKAGETLNIVDGAQLSGGYDGVDVVGGTLNISGGSISASYIAVLADGGTVNISGGSISGEFGVDVVGGGTASISGGSISATSGGIGVFLETS